MMNIPPRKERVYVKVNSDFDATGYMRPNSITWADGRTFRIEKVRDIRTASSVGMKIDGSCYTVVIGGRERHLFFERASISSSGVGRWFVQAVL